MKGWITGWSLIIAAAMAIMAAPAASRTHTTGSPAPTPAAAADAGLPVMPFAGTPDASPSTSVIFSSLAPSELRGVRVTGSRSGVHAGRLVALPAGQGATFLPSRRFSPGERVRVTAKVRSLGVALGLMLARPRAGRAASAPAATRLAVSFRVAVPRGVFSPPVTAGSSSGGGSSTLASVSRHGIGPTQHFHSEPWLHPPVVRSTPDPDTTSGDIFLTPNKSPENGVLILNARGQLVWFRPVHPSVFNAGVQRYRGRPVLTWWQGSVKPGPDDSYGEDVVLDRHYRTLAVVHAGDGYAANLHEFQITRQGTALLNVAVPVKKDLSSVGGPSDGTVEDDIIQNVDIRTGRVLWEWHALGHVPLTASYFRPTGSAAYDYFHLNSIEQLPDGDLLVSARNTWAVYKISVRTGRVLWTLGGKRSSFRSGPGASFAWQHDVRKRGRTITVFDNAWGGFGGGRVPSSAKVLRLGRHGIRLIHSYSHHPRLRAYIMGSAEQLPSGNVFVGWGSYSEFSEYSRRGRQIFNGSFAPGVVSYRAQRVPWAGQPAGPPAISVSTQAGGKLTVWASWNGATGVAAWRVMGGPSAGQLTRLATRGDRSFETTIRLPAQPRYIMVQALSANGHVLGSSSVHRVARTSRAGSSSHSAGASGASTFSAQAAIRGGGSDPRFRSQPGLHPPAVHVTRNPDAGSGDIFLTPEHGAQAGPMILNPRGQLVWFDPVPFTGMFAAFNLEVERYQGHPVLTWWRGTVGGQSPEDVIMNTAYRTVAVIRAANGDATDEHEFQITPQGTALIDAHRTVRANLSGVGGPSSGTVVDCLIQEIDIRTRRLVWQWDALAHVPVSASYARPAGSAGYDYFHCNSVQQLADGNLLISARNTWAVYEVSHRTGRVIWTIGGKHSSFRLARRARFEWQHDAHLAHGVLTVFDDAAGDGHQEEAQSSGKALRVHTRKKTVTLIRRYTHSPPLISTVEGSVQTLPNHSVFVGWGGEPDFSEYAPDGRQIFNGTFRLGVHSYRAYRFIWHAHPATRPRLARAARPGGDVKLWMSWNGATEVASWRVLGGSRPGRLRRLAVSPRTAFETALKLPDDPRYLAVRAVDFRGHILRTSKVRAVPPHLDIFGSSAFVSAATGQGELPLACFAHRACRVALEIRTGRAVLARVASQRLRSGRGTLVSFHLSSAGRRELDRARHHRLPVRVMVRDLSGIQAARDTVLIPYSTSGSGPERRLSEAPGLRILGTTQFVSSTGAGGILAACDAATPCPVRATVSSHGTQIATAQSHQLGVNEVGVVGFRLTAAGRSRLAQAPGNQLAATVALTGGGQSATGRVALVRYR